MIRKATQNDLDGIIAIYNAVKLDRSKLGDVAYETQIQKNGFLLGLDDAGTFTKEINDAYAFLVSIENNKVVGYLIADHSDDQKFYDDQYKTWFDEDLKDFYYQNPKGMTIASLAVDPDFGHKGIATALLHVLEEQLVKESFEKLFSIITVGPLTNCPSIIWHTRHGFQRLAMGRPRKNLFNLAWYSGILMYKAL